MHQTQSFKSRCCQPDVEPWCCCSCLSCSNPPSHLSSLPACSEVAAHTTPGAKCKYRGAVGSCKYAPPPASKRKRAEEGQGGGRRNGQWAAIRTKHTKQTTQELHMRSLGPSLKKETNLFSSRKKRYRLALAKTDGLTHWESHCLGPHGTPPRPGCQISFFCFLNCICRLVNDCRVGRLGLSF
jgi:hypothetical protein